MKMHSKKRSGMTLLEVVVAMIVFMILALGITAGTLQARAIAHDNILKNTAYTVAQGYLEQIKSMSEVTIIACLNNPASNELPTRSADPNNSGNVREDPLFLNGVNDKEIVIDVQDSRALTMNMTFDVDIEDLGWGAYAIEINFTYESRQLRAQTRSGQLRSIITKMQ